MIRKLFTFCCAVSAALLLAVVFLWLRSHWTVDSLTLTRLQRSAGADADGGYTSCTASSLRGTLVIRSITVLDRSPLDDRLLAWRTEPAAAFLPAGGGWGVSFSSQTNVTAPASWFQGKIPHLWTLRVPFWTLALPPALLPAWWVILRRHSKRVARRQRLGLCSQCGYDLRATPGLCPECGAAPAVPRGPTANQQAGKECAVDGFVKG
jgi:hypothetical protein